MAEKRKKNDGAPARGEKVKAGVDGIAGTGGSSGAGGVVAPVEGMGSLSGIDPGDAGREAPMPGSVGKHEGGTRDMQESDGGMPGRTRGPDGETVPNQSGGKKGQKGQRDGDQSNKTQS